MSRKVITGVLLFLSLLFAGVIVYTQIKIRQVEKARQETQQTQQQAQEAMVSEEVGLPILEPLSSKIVVEER